MNIFDNFLKFFLNKSLSIGTKSVVVLLIVILAISTDITFQFSTHFVTSSKLDEISKIEKLKKDYFENQKLIRELEKIEKDVLTRSTIYENIKSSMSFKQTSILKKDEQSISINRSKYWHYSTSGLLWIVFMIIMPFTLFTQEKITLQLIMGLALLELIGFGFLLFSGYISGLIPILNANHVWLNYLLNIFLHFLTCYFFFLLIKEGTRLNNEKKKEDKEMVDEMFKDLDKEVNN